MNVYLVGVDTGKYSGLLSSSYMKKELDVLGYEVEQFPVKDAESLQHAFDSCAKSDSLILCPLSGNLRADAACIHEAAALCSLPLVENEELAARLAKKTNLPEKEALALSALPQGARIFPSRKSLLPGFEVAGRGFHIVMMPSDPEEQSSLFFGYVYQILAKTANSNLCTRVLRVMEMNQSEVEYALADLLKQNKVCIAIYPKRSEVILRLSCNLQDCQQSAQMCNAAVRTVLERLGDHVYGIDVNGIEQALALKCIKKNIHIAFAESGSSGLAAKRFQKVDKDRKLMVSAYSCRPTELQLSKLGINDKIASQFGAVSVNVATAMALGASTQTESGDLLGIGISLPDAEIKNRKGYIAAVLNGRCLIQELDITNYRSLSQMTFDAVARVFNLARKLADAFPESPADSFDAEEVVVQGIETSETTLSEQRSGKSTALSKNQKGSKGELMSMTQQPSTPKPPKGVKGIFYRLFPNRDDSKFDKVRKILIWICVCVFIGSMTYLIDFGVQNKKSKENIANLQDMMAQAEKDAEEGKVESIDGYPSDYLPKFHSFYQQNSDIKGWLKIDGTNVNFPVVQGPDNDYYHRLGFDKEYDFYGTPYIDFESDVKSPSTNIVIYGHNIRNDGQMFNDLTKYKQLSFYKEHPLITFDSVYRLGTYKILGAYITNTNSEHDNGKVFKYTEFIDAENEKEFNEFIDEVKRRSIFDTPVDAEFGDELLTLSTCTYEFKEARFVVVARKVREGEDTAVDTSKAVVNDDAYYPAVYADAVEYAKKLGKVKSIAIQGSREVNLTVGETATLTAKVSPADAPIQTCLWDSSNKAVATVDKNSGVVTAVGAGKANITVTADDGGFVDNIVVVVKSNGKQLNAIALNPQNITMKQKEKVTISAALDPVDAQATLSWKSSDDSIVRVTGDNTSAVLTAVNPGEAEITVTTSDGSKSASCKVSVLAAGDETKPGISFTQATVNLKVGESRGLRLNVTPAGADVGAIFYNNTSDIIRLEEGEVETEAIVTALKPGSAVVSVETGKGFTARCTITVEGGAETAPQEVKLSLQDAVVLPGDYQTYLRYFVEPAGTELVWTSSNPNVVEVDSNGKVDVNPLVNKTTDVTITVSTKDGKYSSQAIVTVKVDPKPTDPSQKPQPEVPENKPQDNQEQKPKPDNKPESKPGNLGLWAEPMQLPQGSNNQLNIGVNGSPQDIDVKCVTSDSSVVSVDNEGNITARNPGTATVTITASNNKTGEYQTVSVDVTVTGDPIPNENGGFGYGFQDDEKSNMRN